MPIFHIFSFDFKLYTFMYPRSNMNIVLRTWVFLHKNFQWLLVEVTHSFEIKSIIPLLDVLKQQKISSCLTQMSLFRKNKKKSLYFQDSHWKQCKNKKELQSHATIISTSTTKYYLLLELISKDAADLSNAMHILCFRKFIIIMKMWLIWA